MAPRTRKKPEIDKTGKTKKARKRQPLSVKTGGAYRIPNAYGLTVRYDEGAITRGEDYFLQFPGLKRGQQKIIAFFPTTKSANLVNFERKKKGKGVVVSFPFSEGKHSVELAGESLSMRPGRGRIAALMKKASSELKARGVEIPGLVTEPKYLIEAPKMGDISVDARLAEEMRGRFASPELEEKHVPAHEVLYIMLRNLATKGNRIGNVTIFRGSENVFGKLNRALKRQGKQTALLATSGHGHTPYGLKEGKVKRLEGLYGAAYPQGPEGSGPMLESERHLIKKVSKAAKESAPAREVYQVLVGDGALFTISPLAGQHNQISVPAGKGDMVVMPSSFGPGRERVGDRRQRKFLKALTSVHGIVNLSPTEPLITADVTYKGKPKKMVRSVYNPFQKEGMPFVITLKGGKMTPVRNPRSTASKWGKVEHVTVGEMPLPPAWASVLKGGASLPELVQEGNKGDPTLNRILKGKDREYEEMVRGIGK